MPAQRKSPLAILAMLALAAGPPVAIFAAMPWLKEQPDGVVFLVTGVAGTLTIVASFALSILHDRQLDEWHRRAARFSSQWGWATGACVVALLLSVPPARDLVVSWAASWSDSPRPERKLLLLTFTFGFMTVVIAQLVCTALLSIGWSLWMSRPASEPR